MIASLPLFHRVQGQKVLLVGDGEAAEPKRRLIERAGGVIVSDIHQAIDDKVRLAFVAYDDAKACEDAAQMLRKAGLLVNVVDRPDLCDFTTPSILDRDPLLIAIGTGGASAGLAKHVRLRLEAILPQSLGKLARALSAAKERLRSNFPDAAQRREVIDAALKHGGVLDPLQSGSDRKVEKWLDLEHSAASQSVHTIGLRSDDPDDLTLRDARLLGMADCLVLDGEIAPQILARARADAARMAAEEFEATGENAGQIVILRRRG